MPVEDGWRSFTKQFSQCTGKNSPTDILWRHQCKLTLNCTITLRYSKTDTKGLTSFLNQFDLRCSVVRMRLNFSCIRCRLPCSLKGRNGGLIAHMLSLLDNRKDFWHQKISSVDFQHVLAKNNFFKVMDGCSESRASFCNNSNTNDVKSVYCMGKTSLVKLVQR